MSDGKIEADSATIFANNFSGLPALKTSKNDVQPLPSAAPQPFCYFRPHHFTRANNVATQ
jgi:hypothetical protein